MNESYSIAAAYYARTSTEEQREKETILSQVSALEAEILKNEETSAGKYIDDGCSGALLDRPALDKLRADARDKRFTKLYIYSPDRLARDLMLQLLIVKEIKQQGIAVVFLSQKFSDSPSDQLLFQMLGAISEFERAQILERTRRGKIHKARCGILIMSVPKFGYNYIPKTDTTPGRYEINPEEASAVTQAFQLFNSPSVLGVRTLAKALYEAGIKNRSRNTKWAKSSLCKILTDTTYIGTTYYNKLMTYEPMRQNGSLYKNKKSRRYRPREEWIPISVPSIIRRELFDATQLKLLRNKELSDRNAKYNYLVRGMIFCSCRKRMYGFACHKKPRYKCSDKYSRYPLPRTCNKGTVDAATVEAAVWKVFLNVLDRPEVATNKINSMHASHEKRHSEMDKQLKDIDRELLNLSEQEERLLTAYTKKVISLSRLKTQTDDFRPKRRSLEEARKRIEIDARDFNAQLKEEEVEGYFRAIKDEALQADFPLRQQIIRQFVHQIVIDGRKALIRCYIPKLGSIESLSSKQQGLNTSYPFTLEINLDRPGKYIFVD
jgi:site-specific DNA recombinase